MKKLLVFIVLCCSIWAAQAQYMRVATYNIRLKTDADQGNLWDDRKAAVADVIKFHGFDIFGVQEAFRTQLDDLSAALPKYKYIGVGRDDGKEKGEHSAIFYDPERFQLEKNGTFWLTEKDTDVPNKGWDAAIVRICTWGVFKDLQNNKRFIFMNTHFDHIGKVARIESGKLILKKAEELAAGLPIILTGDFNINEENEAYLALANNPLIQDTYNKAAFVYEPNSTFNGWGKALRKKSRIDHIFVTPNFTVRKWGILTDTYEGKFPSDHFPVMVDLNW